MTRFFFHSLLFLPAVSLAQESAHIRLERKDTLCLEECFKKAHWEAHTRNFFMSTFNEGPLKDDYAMASGAGIGVITKPLHGFQAGLSGFFTFKVFSSGIDSPDSLTGLGNRYEVGLFDIENSDNHNDMDRLEELYLRYSFRKFSIAGGRMNLNTPFFNPQDGRMRPTLEEGVWINIKEWSKFSFAGGWISSVSPRSTVRWMPLSESMGLYSQGMSVEGIKSDYRGNIQGNSGMAIANINYIHSKNCRLILWNGFLDNIVNTFVAEVRAQKVSGNYAFYHNILYTQQTALNNGGNADPAKSYFGRGAQSNVISTQVGLKYKKRNININYTHITGDGRYLMPREWGRESFYTFLPRERLEGAGNVHAATVKYEVTSCGEKIKTIVAYGYNAMPDVTDYRLNKYSLPSYHHLYLESVYSFTGFFKGMKLRGIISSKLHAGNRPDELKYIYNKVNMINFNVILDYRI